MPSTHSGKVQLACLAAAQHGTVYNSACATLQIGILDVAQQNVMGITLFRWVYDLFRHLLRRSILTSKQSGLMAY